MPKEKRPELNLRLLQLEVNQRLDDLGLQELTQGQMELVRDNFCRHLDLGSSDRSLAMIDTQVGERHLGLGFLDKVEDGTRVLTVDVGGSGLKWAVWEKQGRGYGIIGGQEPAERQIKPDEKKTTAKSFFGTIAQEMREQGIDLKGVKALGLIFSFPAQAEEDPQIHNIDVRAEDKLTKDVELEGLEEAGLVGRFLVDQLKETYGDKAEEIGFDQWQIATANDGTAISGGGIALIVGTGFGGSIVIDGRAYNMEPGGFADQDLPLSNLVRLYDLETTNPGQYLNEEQISGQGVGGQLGEFMKQMIIGGYLEERWWRLMRENKERIDAKLVSKILGANRNYGCLWGDKGQWEVTWLWPADTACLKPACERIVQRSAQVLAAEIAGMILKRSETTGQPERVEIPVEGSFFWKTPGYREMVLKYLRDLTPASVQFLGEGKRIGLGGMARIAFNLL